MIVGRIPVVRTANALLQADGRLPAKGRQAGGIEELARCAVGLGSIEFDVSLIADDVLYEFRQFENADVLPPTDIDDLGCAVILHQKYAGISQIIDMQELAARRARTPDSHRLRAGRLGFVKLPDEGRQYM